MVTRNYRSLQMHRIPYTDLTEAQMAQALRPAASGPSSKSTFSDAFAGKHLKIVTNDGPRLEYNFRNSRELELSENGGKVFKAGYGALDSHGLVLLSHMIPGTQRGYEVVVDPRTRLVTVFEASFSGYAAAETAAAADAKRAPQFKNGHRNREAQRKIWFGYVDDGSGCACGAPHLYQPPRGQGNVLEAGQRHRAARVLCVDPVFEFH